MAGPLVSVIIPCYNAAQYVGDALDSVIAQTYPHWEAIVVNDGSTDSSADVVRSYMATDPRIRLINQVNRGLGAARNAGIAEAQGEWFLFLDADDTIAANMLFRATDDAIANGAQIVVTGWTAWYPSLEIHHDQGAPAYGGFVERLYHQNQMPVHAALVHRSVMERAGTFDEELRHVHDWDLWIRAARAGCRFSVLPECLAVYRMLPASLSRRPLSFYEAGLEVLRRAHSADPRLSVGGRAEDACRCDMREAWRGWALTCAGRAIVLDATELAVDLVLKMPNGATVTPPCIATLMEGLWFAAALPPSSMSTMWAQHGSAIMRFLVEWERRAQSPGLAAGTLTQMRIVPDRVSPEVVYVGFRHSVQSLARTYGARALFAAGLRRILDRMTGRDG